MSRDQQGARGLDLRPGKPQMPSWFWVDDQVGTWPVSWRLAFLYAYTRADWRTGYWQVDVQGLRAYASLDSDPALTLGAWASAGLVDLVRPGLVRFVDWIADQHGRRRNWADDPTGRAAHALICQVEGADVARALLPGRLPGDPALALGAPLAPEGEADPQARAVGGGGTPPPPAVRSGEDGRGVVLDRGGPPVERSQGGSDPVNGGGWTVSAARGWAYATLQGQVGLPILDPAPWHLDALAALLTRVGAPAVVDAARYAVKADTVGSLRAFLDQVGRWMPPSVVSLGCRHPAARPGTVCPACRRRIDAQEAQGAVASALEGQAVRSAVQSTLGAPGHENGAAQVDGADGDSFALMTALAHPTAQGARQVLDGAAAAGDQRAVLTLAGLDSLRSTRSAQD